MIFRFFYIFECVVSQNLFGVTTFNSFAVPANLLIDTSSRNKKREKNVEKIHIPIDLIRVKMIEKQKVNLLQQTTCLCFSLFDWFLIAIVFSSFFPVFFSDIESFYWIFFLALRRYLAIKNSNHLPCSKHSRFPRNHSKPLDGGNIFRFWNFRYAQD